MESSNDKHETTFYVDVADKCFCIKSRDEALASVLISRWSNFINSDQQRIPDLTIKLKLERVVPVQSEEVEVTTRADGAFLTVVIPGKLKGVVDRDSGLASVSIDLNRVGDDPNILGMVVSNFVRVISLWLMPQWGRFHLHASGLSFGARAFIFLGRSGTGKTTVVSAASPQARFCDDIVIVGLCASESGVLELKTWPALYDFTRPLESFSLGLQVAGIYLLDPNREVLLSPLSRGRASYELTHHLISLPGHRAGTALDFLETLSFSETKFFRYSLRLQDYRGDQGRHLKEHDLGFLPQRY